MGRRGIREEVNDSVDRSAHQQSAEGAEMMISMLRSEARFFIDQRAEIEGIIEDLKGIVFPQYYPSSSFNSQVLNDQSLKSWLKETTEAAQVKGFVGEDCVLRLSQILGQRQRNSIVGPQVDRPVVVSKGEASQPPQEIDRNDQIKELKREEEAHSRISTLGQSFIEDYVSSAMKDVMASLTEGAADLSVVSLVGPPGIGKTSLARKVYHSYIARQHFELFAWIDVSEPYNMRELIKNMIMQIDLAQTFTGGLDTCRTMELIGALRQSLQSKRYMFIFDDVSGETLWHIVKQFLPNNGKGSRVLIITRKDNVVASCQEYAFSRVHKVEPLDFTKCQEIFGRIVFRDEPQQTCPSELEQLSGEIVGLCKGYPLTVMAISAFLFTKDKTVSEWKRLHDILSLHVKSDPDILSIPGILTLSIGDLPSKLKTCFLCFSIFPEDAFIPREKLLKLWIAEGFVEKRKGSTLEEVAEESLNELISRNLVQACPGSYGLENYFHVHKSMHDIARKNAQELDFCCFWENNKSEFGRHCRRLSISNDVDTVLETVETGDLHAVFLFNTDAPATSSLITLFRRYRFLTLLDFEYIPIEELPEELGSLSSLVYLCLKNTKVKTLPKSLEKLQRLETLDVRNTLLNEVPIEITRINDLRHLLVSVSLNQKSEDSSRGVKICKGIGCLEKLCALMIVDAQASGTSLIRELAMLRCLKKLGIAGVTEEIAAVLGALLDAFPGLESLSLQARDNFEVLNLENMSFPPVSLRDLALKGPLKKIPAWIFSLQNLGTLKLSMSRMIEDPLMYLSSLPNLASLWLCRAYEGDCLQFKKGGFEKLKVLVLSALEGLNTVEVEDGSLPLLEEIRIGPAPLMTQLPSGIEHLKNLKVLANFEMTREFVLSMQPGGGSDYSKVQSIHSVIFWYRVHGRRYSLYKLGDSGLLDRLQGSYTNGVARYQYNMPSSFCSSDSEDDDEVGQLSFSEARATTQPNSISQWSFSSGYYTDDVEE